MKMLEVKNSMHRSKMVELSEADVAMIILIKKKMKAKIYK